MTKAEQKTLEDAKNQLASALTKLAETEKTLAVERASLKYWSDRAGEVEKQLGEMHAFLDSLPGAPPRETNEEKEYNRTTHSPQSRFAIWLASRLRVTLASDSDR